MEMKIQTLEEGFIHDTREILTHKGLSDKAKVLNMLKLLFMYDTVKDIERIWPDAKKMFEQAVEEWKEGEAE